FQLTTAGAGNGFHLTYSNVSAPSTAGFYTFTTASRNGSGATVQIASSPAILVSSTTNIFQRGGSAATTNVSNDNSTSTMAIAKPIGVVAGDVMIANIALNKNTNFPSLTGWTTIATKDFEGNGQHHRSALLYRIAT